MNDTIDNLQGFFPKVIDSVESIIENYGLYAGSGGMLTVFITGFISSAIVKAKKKRK